MAIVENSNLHKMGSSCLQILDSEIGFQTHFRSKNMARTPLYTNMATTPPPSWDTCSSPFFRPIHYPGDPESNRLFR